MRKNSVFGLVLRPLKLVSFIPRPLGLVGIVPRPLGPAQTGFVEHEWKDGEREREEDDMDRAKVLLSEGDLHGSCRLLTEFIERRDNPECLADAYNTRGHIRYLWVDFDEAIEDYTEAIRWDPEFAVAYYNRGQVHYRLGRFKLAERDLVKALELNPGFTDAQRNLDQVKNDLARGHQFNKDDQFREQET